MEERQRILDCLWLFWQGGVLFIFGILEERGMDVFSRIARMPVWFRMGLYLAVIFAIPMVGQPPSSTGGFIYAQF